MDTLLSALLADATDRHNTERLDGTLAALTDRLTEVEPADRLLALTALVERLRDVEQKNRNARMYLADQLTHHPGRKRLELRRHVPQKTSMADAHIRRDLQVSVSRAIAEAMADGHWYAIRVSTEQHGSVYPPNSSELVRTADIVPLDGGPVNG